MRMKQQQRFAEMCLWCAVTVAALVVVAIAAAPGVAAEAQKQTGGSGRQQRRRRRQQSEWELPDKASVDYQVSTGEFSEALSVVVHGGGDLDFSAVQVDVVHSGSGNNGNNGVFPYVRVVVIPLEDNDRKTGGGGGGQSNSIIIGADDVRSSGLGAIGDDGKYYLCCNEAAIGANACDPNYFSNYVQEGEPIVPHNNNNGDDDKEDERDRRTGSNNIRTQSLPVGSTGGQGGDGFNGAYSSVSRFRQTSHAAVVFANCQQQEEDGGGGGGGSDASSSATTLRVHGTVMWKSNVTVAMVPFFVVVTMIHLGLCLWYRILMVRNETSRINVENWIYVTLVFAAVNSFVETTNVLSEVFESDEIMFFKISSMLLSLARHSVTRCLYLVLSLGLGVAVKSLPWITTFLVAVFLAVDVFLLWGMHMAFYMNEHIRISHSALRWTERVFTYWIPIALLITMWRLRKKKERAKLFRYKVFLGIYAITAILTFVEKRVFSIRGSGRGSVSYREANDVLYLFPLACIAVLWRPNPEQRKYSHAYVLLEDGKEEQNTIPALGRDGGEGGDNDLELTEYNDDNDGECSNDGTVEDQNRVV